MIGIVLAGGTGSRLWPITRGVSKQLLPIFDKPMIHYPISTLMSAGIREIVIISTPDDLPNFVRLLGNGAQYGLKFHFRTQEQPKGLAQAFLIAEDLIENQKVCLILGDNLFYGSGLGRQLQNYNNVQGAQVFAYRVTDPENYGVVTFGQRGEIDSIVEKPTNPTSNLAIPGIYFYDESILEVSKIIRPSARGELEISSVNRHYLDVNKLKVQILPRGTVWLDTGTLAGLHDASAFVKTIQDRQGFKISCLEEIAYRNGWLTKKELLNLAHGYNGNEYGTYLIKLSEESL